MESVRRRVVGALGAGALGAALPRVSRAQAWGPTGPVRIVIPTPPGGGIDLLARLVAQKLTAVLGQPVLVDPRPGATGTIAANAVARSAPDGQTLLFSHSAVLTNPLLQPNSPYKFADLAPLTVSAILPIGYGIDASLPATDLKSFLALARASATPMTFASYGTGSGGHLLGEMVNRAAGVRMVHVPYKGEAPAIADLLGGQVHSAYASPGGLTRVPAGRIRLVAVASPRRMTMFPDVPTFGESGLPEADLPGWAGFFVAAPTPQPVQDRLQAELMRILAADDVRTKTLEVGFEPAGLVGEPMRAFLAAQAQRVERVIREQNIKVE